MQITVNRLQLLASLRRVAPAANARATLPVLSCLLLRAVKGSRRAEISATDMTLTLVSALDADVAEGGSAAIPAHALLRYAARLPKEDDDGPADVSISTLPPGAADDPATAPGAARWAVSLRCGPFLAELPAMDPAEFPAVPEPDGPASAGLPAAALVEAVAAALPAASADSSRPILSGVHLEVARGGDLIAVATDGRHLVRAAVPGAASVRRASSTLPPAACRALAAMPCADDDGETSATLWLGPVAHVRLSTGDGLSCVTLSGAYPNWRAVVPDASAWTLAASCPAHLLLASLQRASAVDPDATVRLRSEGGRAEGGRLILESSAAGGGARTFETLPLTSGSGIDALLNASLLATAVAAVETPLCEILRAPSGDPSAAPLVVRGDSLPVRRLCVVMPLRAS